jgi:hypothetical protein
LVETETFTNDVIRATKASGQTAYIYFKVCKVSGGAETILADWTLAGSRTTNGVSEVDKDWDCPATAFAAGDKIRVYIRVKSGTVTNEGSFDSITTYAGLLASTWTFHLWLERDLFLGTTDASFYYGTLDPFPSRITNVGIGDVGGAVLRRLLVGVGL